MVDAYDSPFFITNDRADIDQEAIEDGTANVWPLSDDAQLRRSPERQYCGNYATYGDKGAAIYVHNATTHALIAAGPNQHRDMTSNWPLVKTKTKAKARAARQLLDVQDQEIRITTTLVNIPSTRVTLAKQGMRLEVKGTHWGPDLDSWHYARIVSAQPQPHSDGSLYDIDLELVVNVDDTSDGPPPPAYSGAAMASLIGIIDTPYESGYIYWDTDGAVAGGGWYPMPASGPLEIVEPSQPFSQIRVTGDQPIEVRIEAAARSSEAVSGPQSATLYVNVNGAHVGSDFRETTTPGLHFWSDEYYVDVHNVMLQPGDVVDVTFAATQNLFWTNQTNLTYLKVGRGTHVWNSNSIIWVGP